MTFADGVCLGQDALERVVTQNLKTDIQIRMVDKNVQNDGPTSGQTDRQTDGQTHLRIIL